MAPSDGTERIDRVLGGAVETGAVPGVVALASKNGEILYEGAHGFRSLRTGVPMTLDTVFWYASMTKALVATGAMQLVERGLVELDEPIGRHVPELAEIKVMDGYDADGRLRLRDPKRPITLRHLLTHTSGFGSDNWSPDALRYIRENGLPSLLDSRRKSLMQPLVVDPGERWEYGLGIDWAGQAIERISGQGLEDFLMENLFDPLGMTDTAWIMRPGRAERRADVHQRRPDGGLEPIHPHLVSQEPEFFMGGGGIYGTAGDYRAFLDMVLAGGRAKNGTAVLEPETVALMSRNNIGEINVGTMVSVVPAASLDANFFPDMDQKWGLSFLINPEPGPHGAAPGRWPGPASPIRSTGPIRPPAYAES